MFYPTLRGKSTVWVTFVSLLSFEAAFSLGDPCRAFCTGDQCMTVNEARVDFRTAEEACRERNGELMTFQRETDDYNLEFASLGLTGNFWIGLRLPAGACSNLSAPLRGYEWTSGGGGFNPSTSWAGSATVCSPRCVSLSNNYELTERMCSDKTDGFLCRTRHKDACKAQALSDSVFFQSSKGCSNAPCEHECKDVKGGYECSCFQGYIPDKKDPKRCNQYCGQEKCSAICDIGSESCYCPRGFILNGKICHDINECTMDECDQECKNTYGSFQCSCREGFVLKDKVKCKKAANADFSTVMTPITDSSMEPASSNNTQRVSREPAVRFLWIWIFAALTVIVLIVTVRCYVVKRQRLREQSSSQRATL